MVEIIVEEFCTYTLLPTAQLERTESRIFVLYCTKREARDIVRLATKFGLTTKV